MRTATKEMKSYNCAATVITTLQVSFEIVTVSDVAANKVAVEIASLLQVDLTSASDDAENMTAISTASVIVHEAVAARQDKRQDSRVRKGYYVTATITATTRIGFGLSTDRNRSTQARKIAESVDISLNPPVKSGISTSDLSMRSVKNLSIRSLDLVVQDVRTEPRN